MHVEIAAILFAILIGVVILFQFGLMAGLPWGEYAMGGKFPGRYPPAMRAACVVQIAILALLGLIVLSHAGQLLTEWHSFASRAIWFVVGFSAVATVLNLITKSKRERAIWAPVSVLLLAASLTVAIG